MSGRPSQCFLFQSCGRRVENATFDCLLNRENTLGVEPFVASEEECQVLCQKVSNNELMGSNHQTTNLVFPNFFLLFDGFVLRGWFFCRSNCVVSLFCRACDFAACACLCWTMQSFDRVFFCCDIASSWGRLPGPDEGSRRRNAKCFELPWHDCCLYVVDFYELKTRTCAKGSKMIEGQEYEISNAPTAD